MTPMPKARIAESGVGVAVKNAKWSITAALNNGPIKTKNTAFPIPKLGAIVVIARI